MCPVTSSRQDFNLICTPMITGAARRWGGCDMAVGYGMLVEQDTAVPMRDGAILRANVYRPEAHGRFPVLMTFGPYGKDVPLREFMQEAWDRLNKTYPEILADAGTPGRRTVNTEPLPGSLPIAT